MPLTTGERFLTWYRSAGKTLRAAAYRRELRINVMEPNARRGVAFVEHLRREIESSTEAPQSSLLQILISKASTKNAITSFGKK